MILEHEMNCECRNCYWEFLPCGGGNLAELRMAKLTEIAEREGGLKQFINGELENLPNRGDICNCNKPVSYDQDLGDDKHQDVCLRCGGRLSNSGTLSKCPKCSSGDISAGNWNCTLYEASCIVDCQKCDCRWNETFTNAHWELVE